MALNGDARRLPEHWHGKPPMHSSFNSWVNKNGKDAYKHFVKDHPKTDLSYEAWRRTDRVYGGYLFYVASLVWAEDDDSDEESVKRRRISRVQSDSRKIATTNGNGASRTAGSATPTRATNSDELNASGKRKRKPRKKYMSQELVASDEEATEEIDVATPPTETETPTKSEVNANGRRKSNSRKPRKKPISDETISPEDEDNDAVEVDAMIIDSPLPDRSVPRTSAPVRISESPKKGTPQQASAKKSRKSFLSEEMVLDEDTKNGNDSIAEVSRPATTPAPRSKPESSNDIKTDEDIDEASKVLIAEGTPDAANTRRGLRDRKPAQQRPYFHDAQVFEEVETEQEDESDLESLSRAHSLEPPQSKPKHFKGKGRAWKKDDSDEDEEFVTPKEKKAARAAKAKAEREKARAEREANENGAEGDITSALMHILEANQTELGEHIGQANGSSKDSAKHKKAKKPRKSSLLSEDLGFGNDASQATPTQPPKRGRGRPRKSENIATPAKASAKASKNAEEAEQRHSPTAAKATQQKGNVVPSSVKTTYPARVLTPGEALLDKIWPMYHKSVVFNTPSAPANAASSQPAARVLEPAHDTSTAEAPPAQIEAVASASTTATGATANADASTEEDKTHAVAAAPVTLSSASLPSHTQTATGPAKREQEEVNGNGNEDDGDTRSIAMSLGSSSDTQL